MGISCALPGTNKWGKSPRTLLLALIPVLGIGVSTVSAAPPDQVVNKHLPATMLPLHVERVIFQDGQLVALASLGDQLLELPIDTSTSPGDDCPILHLALGPIHLNLLGLQVDTSPICLAIDAVPGEGALLGNLLCDVSHLLDNGGSLGDILGDLTEGELSDVLGGIADLLNEVLGGILSPNSLVGVGSSQAAAAAAAPVNILHLAVGPVDLNLLGLAVHLDDCDDGPVTVDITAVPGAGNLLGNLLANLSHLLDNNAAGPAIANALNRVADAILALL